MAENQELELVKQGGELETAAKAIRVVGESDLGEVRTFLAAIKAAKDKCIAFFKPMKEKAFAAHKAVTSQEKEALAPLENAEKIVNAEVRLFNQRRADAARKVAEAEAARVAAELKAAAKAGDAAAFQQKKEEAAIVAQAVAPQAPKPVVDGAQFRKDLNVLVFDAVKFIKFVVAQTPGGPPADCVEINLGKVKAWAKKAGLTNHSGNGFEVKETLGDMIIKK